MGRLFPVTFCELDEYGRWNRKDALWTEELAIIPTIGHTIRLKIDFDPREDKKFPEREQTLPALAKKTYCIVGVHEEVLSKYEGFAGQRITEHHFFAQVKEQLVRENKPLNP